VKTGRPVEALVLSGNGSYAAYEVGVALALFSGQSPGTSFQPLQPLVLSGTSGGGVNAALLTTLFDGDFVEAGRKLEQIWLQRIARRTDDCDSSAFRLRGAALFKPECLVEQPLRTLSEISRDTAFLARSFLQRATQFAGSKDSIEQRVADGFDIGVFISADPTLRLIRETISLPKLRRTLLRVRLAATNWVTGALRIFVNSDFADDVGNQMIMASTAIPGILPPVTIRGETYADGGIFMNTPLKPAIDAGADVIHMIWMEADIRKMPLGRYESTLEAILRTRNIANAAIIASDLETARRENSSISLLQKAASGGRPDGNEIYYFTRTASQVYQQLLKSKMPKELTIHCYHPVNVLIGQYAFASFDLRSVRQMIERGFADARRHDCVASGCVIPGQSLPPRP
jgi:predicted acylesterase/phospholipase RssA